MSQAWQDASVFVFDVEGTLVDAAMATLECWRATLKDFGHDVGMEELHRYSGMDGGDMLKELLPDVPADARKRILASQGKRYRSDYLPSVRPLPDARALLQAVRALDRKIALATDCAQDELKHYLALVDIADLVDAVACGDDVAHGKPHPDVVTLALGRANGARRSAVMIGDTPYDAQAATAAGIVAIGLLSGHFAARDLERAGCAAVFRDPSDLRQALVRAAAASGAG